MREESLFLRFYLPVELALAIASPLPPPFICEARIWKDLRLQQNVANMRLQIW